MKKGPNPNKIKNLCWGPHSDFYKPLQYVSVFHYCCSIVTKNKSLWTVACDPWQREVRSNPKTNVFHVKFSLFLGLSALCLWPCLHTFGTAELLQAKMLFFLSTNSSFESLRRQLFFFRCGLPSPLLKYTSLPLLPSVWGHNERAYWSCPSTVNPIAFRSKP